MLPRHFGWCGLGLRKFGRSDTCNGEDANATGFPDFVLFEEEREQNEHAAIMDHPPDVDRSAQTSLAVGKVVDTSRYEQRQSSFINRLDGV